MNNTIAIIKKQLKDTLKNKTVLIQFIMFPMLTLIMNHTIAIDGMPENFFVNLFATMYIGMAPLTSIAAIIAEEKEKNTLRVLIMSNVRPYEYLLGIGIYVWVICMIGAVVICTAGGYKPQGNITFMSIMAIGILASLLAGTTIGTYSHTQMMATSVTLPVMMFFSFMPMLSLFNTTIAKIAKFTFTEQISLGQVTNLQLKAENICIIIVNILIAAVLFSITYKLHISLTTLKLSSTKLF